MANFASPHGDYPVTEPDEVFGSFVNSAPGDISADAYSDDDPFQIGVSPEEKKEAGTSTLAPRVDVRFKIHEEVSSKVKGIGDDGSSAASESEDENDGSSKVFVLGTVFAQVRSSDALKNAPFVLVASSSSGAKVDFSPNESVVKTYATKTEGIDVNVVKIPKGNAGYVPIGNYKISEVVDRMPLLLEKKVTRVMSNVRIALQVRSKLSNPAGIFSLSIALSISEFVDASSVTIESGDGEFDELQRKITWKVPHLPKGDSFMVSATGTVVDRSADLKFPAMLRCQSQDQISSASFQAIEARGYPSTVSHSSIEHTYRIIHRLN